MFCVVRSAFHTALAVEGSVQEIGSSWYDRVAEFLGHFCYTVSCSISVREILQGNFACFSSGMNECCFALLLSLQCILTANVGKEDCRGGCRISCYFSRWCSDQDLPFGCSYTRDAGFCELFTSHNYGSYREGREDLFITVHFSLLNHFSFKSLFSFKLQALKEIDDLGDELNLKRCK